MIAQFYLAGLAGAILVSLTIIDLVWIPLGLAAIYYVRMTFKANYLDEELGLTDKRSIRGFVITGLLFISVSWILIFLMGLLGLAFAPLFPFPL